MTPTTARLRAYWNDPERERKLFFCQIKAVETAIYITEVARKFNDDWIENIQNRRITKSPSSSPGCLIDKDYRDDAGNEKPWLFPKDKALQRGRLQNAGSPSAWT